MKGYYIENDDWLFPSQVGREKDDLDLNISRLYY